MLGAPHRATLGGMRPPAPPRAAPTPARAHTSRQIRRFSLIWLVSAISVLIAVAASSQVAAGYRAPADKTARAATSAQLTAARLRAGIEREVTDHTAYDITGDPAYVGRFGRDAAQNARLLDRLEREAGIAASGSFDKGLLRRTLKAVSAWLDANDEAMVATAAKRRGSTLPQQGAPSVDRTADGLLSALQRIDQALPANAAAAVEGSRRMAD